MNLIKNYITTIIIGIILVSLCFFLYYMYSEASEERNNYKEALIMNEFSNSQKSLRNLVVFAEKMLDSEAYLYEGQIDVVKELGNPMKGSVPNVTTNLIDDTEIKSYLEEYNNVYEQIYNHVIINSTNNNKEQLLNIYNDLDKVYNEYVKAIEWNVVNKKEIKIDYETEVLRETTKKIERILNDNTKN